MELASIMADEVRLVWFIADWAAALGCSRRTVERMRRADELPAPLPLSWQPCWARETALAFLRGESPSRRPMAMARRRA